MTLLGVVLPHRGGQYFPDQFRDVDANSEFLSIVVITLACSLMCVLSARIHQSIVYR